MKTQAEMIEWFIKHQSLFVDFAVQDIWIIVDMILNFYETEPDVERKEVAFNNIKFVLKGMFYAERT